MIQETITQAETGQRLHPEQDYVFEIAELLGIPVKVVRHMTVTKTCYEKAELLQETDTTGSWVPERIVKALYFHDGSYENYVGIITPEFGTKVESARIISSVIPGVTEKRARHYSSSSPPYGMAYGTCTPFPQDSVMDGSIAKLVIIDHPTIDNQLADISAGGDDEKAFKTSIHLPYKGIFDILSYKFRDKITKI